MDNVPFRRLFFCVNTIIQGSKTGDKADSIFLAPPLEQELGTFPILLSLGVLAVNVGK